MLTNTLRITEVFFSIQGEANTIGYPTVFVRLTGCPLRCSYCDSEYAFYGGVKHTISALLDQVKSYGASHVCVTGGEPLAQPNCLPLLTALCDLGLNVSLETSGAMPIADVDPRVSRVMDLKTPSSQEVGRNDYNNIGHLNHKDQLKFVIADRSDYKWSIFQIDRYDLSTKVDHIFFSPSYEQLTPAQLADWILQDQLPVRLQVQLHKLLWGDKPGV